MATKSKQMKKVVFIMSVVQNVLIGRSKQKIGNAVFTTWKGINVLKSKPLTVENPNTINQQMRRSALAQGVALYRAVSQVILLGWKELAIGKSEYNAFISFFLKNAVDYSAPPAASPIAAQMLMTKGTITKQLITTATSSGAADTVTVNWDSSVLQPGQATSDKALIVVNDATAGNIAGFVTNVSRSANTAVVNYPYDITAADNLDVWIGFYNPSTGKAGDSDYALVVAGA